MGKFKPTVIIDSREQIGWTFDCDTMKETLETGDYSLMGFMEYIRIERKELGDFIGCLGAGRDRFKRELQRLKSYDYKAVIIECNASDIEKGNWRMYKSYLKKCKEAESKGLEKPKCKCIAPAHAWGSLASWSVKYKVPFLFGGTRETSAKLALLLMTAWVNNAKDFASRFKDIK